MGNVGRTTLSKIYACISHHYIGYNASRTQLLQLHFHIPSVVPSAPDVVPSGGVGLPVAPCVVATEGVVAATVSGVELGPGTGAVVGADVGSGEVPDITSVVVSVPDPDVVVSDTDGKTENI